MKKWASSCQILSHIWCLHKHKQRVSKALINPYTLLLSAAGSEVYIHSSWAQLLTVLSFKKLFCVFFQVWNDSSHKLQWVFKNKTQLLIHTGSNISTHPPDSDSKRRDGSTTDRDSSPAVNWALLEHRGPRPHMSRMDKLDGLRRVKVRPSDLRPWNQLSSMAVVASWLLSNPSARPQISSWTVEISEPD